MLTQYVVNAILSANLKNINLYFNCPIYAEVGRKVLTYTILQCVCLYYSLKFLTLIASYLSLSRKAS